MAKTNAALLSEHPDKALNDMAKMTRTLCALADKEFVLLQGGDINAFTELQNRKEKLAGQYRRASEEFRSRIEDFRDANQKTLYDLENLQRSLSEKMRANADMIASMINPKARKQTHETLLSAQELGTNDNKKNGKVR